MHIEVSKLHFHILSFGMGVQGRSKNVWESPKGCLLFSFTIQMEDGRIVPHVQYVVSLAMTAAINDVCRQNVRIFREFYMHLNQVKLIYEKEGSLVYSVFFVS